MRFTLKDLTGKYIRCHHVEMTSLYEHLIERQDR